MAFTFPENFPINDILYTNAISMFFRTRQEEGLLFYIGGVNSGSTFQKTFLSAMLENGHVVVKLRFDVNMETFTYEGPFNDGEQHFLEVFRNQGSLVITVDGKQQNDNFNARYPLDLTYLFVGGFPSASRKRRQAATDLPIDAPPFKGTLQDARLNGYLLSFFATDTTNEEFESFPLPDATASNIKEGEQSDDVCKMLDPCVNNGTCRNVFFNDYQ